MKRKTKNPRVGRSFEDYLDEEGDLQEATALETDPSVTLATISRAATALGRSIRVRLATLGYRQQASVHCTSLRAPITRKESDSVIEGHKRRKVRYRQAQCTDSFGGFG